VEMLAGAKSPCFIRRTKTREDECGRELRY
jgi:hypothetical protein